MLPITELTLIHLKMNMVGVIYTKKTFGHQDKNKIINPAPLLTDQNALLESP